MAPARGPVFARLDGDHRRLGGLRVRRRGTRASFRRISRRVFRKNARSRAISGPDRPEKAPGWPVERFCLPRPALVGLAVERHLLGHPSAPQAPSWCFRRTLQPPVDTAFFRPPRPGFPNRKSGAAPASGSGRKECSRLRSRRAPEEVSGSLSREAYERRRLGGLRARAKKRHPSEASEGFLDGPFGSGARLSFALDLGTARLRRSAHGKGAETERASTPTAPLIASTPSKGKAHSRGGRSHGV